MSIWGKLDRTKNASIKKVVDEFRTCAQRHSDSPRFKLTTGTANLRVNHKVQVDKMLFDSLPAVDIIDKATQYAAARLVIPQTSEEV